MALTDKQIQAAYPHSTQTIEIEAFVKNDEIPFVYLAPTQLRRADQQGAKIYALLRETLLKTKLSFNPNAGTRPHGRRRDH